jgi:hypothetical protein
VLKNNYFTVIDAISDLQARGFFLDFSIIGNQLLCAQEQCYLRADEVVVLEMYRFRSEGNLRDETEVYGIESVGQSLKGILLNSSVQTPTLVPAILSGNIGKFSA